MRYSPRRSQITLSITYPLEQHPTLDKAAETVVGRKRGSSGGGISGLRDLQFYFSTTSELDAALRRLQQDGRYRIQTVYVEGWMNHVTQEPKP